MNRVLDRKRGLPVVVRKLYKFEPRTADRNLAVYLVMFCALTVIGLLRGNPWAAAISGVGIIVFLAWRFWKGPMVGHVIVQVDEDHLTFNDRTNTGWKKMRLALADVAEIRVVGPRSARRIRVQSCTGKAKEVYRGLRGKHLTRVVGFLRENLPGTIKMVEDEPPSVFGEIRGDF